MTDAPGGPTDLVCTLSFFSGYACRERGACCTAGWPIPIEREPLARVRRALTDGLLHPASRTSDLFVVSPDAPDDAPALVACTSTGCVFHRADAARARCELQRTLGVAALPHACRQFPRVVVAAPNRLSVTLSAFCPTVTELLHDDVEPAIVARSRAEGEVLTGLDTTGGLPPALRPDMLMSWEAWWRWEAAAIRVIRGAGTSAEAIARLSIAVERVRGWHPADGNLEERIDTAFAPLTSCLPPTGDAPPTLPDIDTVVDGLVGCVPGPFQQTAHEALMRRGRPVRDDVRRRLLAAHAFANWTAHLGEGLRTWLRSIASVHVLLEGGIAPRDVDLVLRHLADPAALARRWRGVEAPPPALRQRARRAVKAPSDPE
jgi:hypothetical protein